MSQEKQQVSPSAPATIKSKSQQQITTTTSRREEQDARLATDRETQSREMRTQTKLVANLHSAANRGKVELVRLLLRCGADVNAQDEQFGNTALHQAAWNGFSQTVQVLCKYRANTSIRNQAQFTPLHLACQQGHNQTARLLLMANAKTEAKNSYGDTPLHTAARYGHAGVARILLSAKSNLNQVNKNNDTPLHIAAAMGRRKITKILMQNGAEPAIKNKQGETAMDIALRKDLIEIQELIANPPPATHRHSQAAAHEAAECAEQSARLSQLERRFGQLYTSTTSGDHLSTGNNFHRGPTTNSATRRQRRARLQHRNRHEPNNHRCHSSNDSSLLAGGGQGQRCAGRLASGEFELAVDVPDELLLLNSNGRASRGGLSMSVAALSGQQVSSAGALTSAGQRHGLQCRKGRTRTLASGASGVDLHLLPSLMGRRRRTVEVQPSSLAPAASGSQALSAGAQSPKTSGAGETTLGEACAPDARDSPKEWALIMAESAKYRAANSPPVMALEEAPRTTTRKLASGNQAKRPSSSPAASFRSSVSKSRRRNLVVARAAAGGSRAGMTGSARRPALLVRRPNLGTCVSKLRLLRLRSVVGKRRSNEKQEEAAGEEEVREVEADNDICAAGADELGRRKTEESKSREAANADSGGEGQAESGDKRATSGEKADSRSVDRSAAAKQAATGRRQERLQRKCAELRAAGGRLVLAPNGCQLLATRPLAALSDDTQLYAIPKKSKQAKQEQQQQLQQQQVASNKSEQNGSTKNGSCGDGKRAPALVTLRLKLSTATPDELTTRTPSAGPALTSDGGHSSACSASSSDSAADSPSSSPIASSSDECIDSVCESQQQQKRNNVQLRSQTRLISQVNLCGPLPAQKARSVSPDSANSAAEAAASSCKRPAVVGVHGLVEGDLHAAGYSVVGVRAESGEPRLCRPTYGQQQQCSRPEVGAPTTLKSTRQEDQQVVAGGRRASGETTAAPTNAGQTRASKLRQLLHLESRNKDTNSHGNGNKDRASSQAKQTEPTGVARTVRPSSGNSNGAAATATVTVGAGDHSAGKTTATLISGRQAPPMSAVAGGYYAYSPVVQSSSELQSPFGTLEDGCSKSTAVAAVESQPEPAAGRQQVSATNLNGTNTKSGTKKSWLMSKFSLSSNSIHHASANSSSTATVTSTCVSQAPIAQQQQSHGQQRQARLSPVRIELSTANGALAAVPAETTAAKLAATDLHCGRLLLGPERKAELITISGGELRKTAATSAADQAAPFHWSAEAPTMARDELSLHHAQLRLHHHHQQQQQQLIRPKSALSATSASLIAAQKSLAAAAAAKVRRDRMVKLVGGDRDDHYDEHDDNGDDDDNDHDENGRDCHDGLRKPSCAEAMEKSAGSKESVLTVKTSEPSFWSRHHQHHNQPLVVATAAHNPAGGPLRGPMDHGSKYLMTGHNHHHRSGTNSVGMSDSSPSNNGAESDNSLQTTTGSMNTDNTSAGGQANSSSSNNSPLGILSRILLNNKGFASNRQKQPPQFQQQQQQERKLHQIPLISNDDDELTVTAADSSSSTLRAEQQQQLHLRNGSLSPNCSPSTPSSSASDQSPQMVNNSSQQQKLDRLHSRSRCPIVLSKSNELQTGANDHHEETKENENKCADHDESTATKATVVSSTPPKLPSKSALKPAGNQRLANGHSEQLNNCLVGDNSVSRIIVESSMNGLPRVSSYTQISSVANSNSSQFKHQLQMDPRAAALCNYHAMNTQQAVNHSTHYGLYSPYGYQNASSSSYHSQQEQAAYNQQHGQQQQPVRPMHHLSHHDLSRPMTSCHHHLSQQVVDDQVDLTLPATAVNYEYYLEAGAPTAAGGPAHFHHPHLSQPARFHYATNATDSLIYPAPNYQPDYSIYIPYASSQASARNPSSSETTTTNTAATHHQLACQNGSSHAAGN